MPRFLEKRLEETGCELVFASDAYLEGDIETSSSIWIKGTVDGSVFSGQDVVVDNDGFIKGSVVCNSAYIKGKVTGEIKAQDILELMSSASVEGEVTASGLIVQQGAVLDGKCSMKKGQP
ncbi:polymer-forming cytoskeletal protein [Spirochaetia bacterium 38H-sp]|uniref:Polymer-forming cytoskeletal protein n=1 Tax=Rarispira pelagica TaxID=3141764 RepID=A0ABU9UDB7_9SPIR